MATRCNTLDSYALSKLGCEVQTRSKACGGNECGGSECGGNECGGIDTQAEAKRHSKGGSNLNEHAHCFLELNVKLSQDHQENCCEGAQPQKHRDKSFFVTVVANSVSSLIGFGRLARTCSRNFCGYISLYVAAIERRRRRRRQR